MVDGAALEKRSRRKASVGSNPTLSAKITGDEAASYGAADVERRVWRQCETSRRGAGVADQARLESACRLRVTVGSNPTLSAYLDVRLVIAVYTGNPRFTLTPVL